MLRRRAGSPVVAAEGLTTASLKDASLVGWAGRERWRADLCRR